MTTIAPQTTANDEWIYRIPADEILAVVCPNTYYPEPITHTEPAGALLLWREEFRCGVRTRTTPDVLAYAARCEENGVEALRGGLPLIASDWFRSAELAILTAADAKAKAARRET
jgi:hypothetical protein